MKWRLLMLTAFVSCIGATDAFAQAQEARAPRRVTVSPARSDLELCQHGEVAACDRVNDRLKSLKSPSQPTNESDVKRWRKDTPGGQVVCSIGPGLCDAAEKGAKVLDSAGDTINNFTDSVKDIGRNVTGAFTSSDHGETEEAPRSTESRSPVDAASERYNRAVDAAQHAAQQGRLDDQHINEYREAHREAGLSASPEVLIRLWMDTNQSAQELWKDSGSTYKESVVEECRYWREYGYASKIQCYSILLESKTQDKEAKQAESEEAQTNAGHLGENAESTSGDLHHFQEGLDLEMSEMQEQQDRRSSEIGYANSRTNTAQLNVDYATDEHRDASQRADRTRQADGGGGWFGDALSGLSAFSTVAGRGGFRGARSATTYGGSDTFKYDCGEMMAYARQSGNAQLQQYSMRDCQLAKRAMIESGFLNPDGSSTNISDDEMIRRIRQKLAQGP